MGISVLTNVAAMEASRNLGVSQSKLSENVLRLSSGLRVNKSADDAAGMAVGSNLAAQIRGYAQAERNANDAVSLIQTAEGGLSEINNILSRMRELAVQSANEGTLSTNDRDLLQTEYDQLHDEVNRIVDVTKYNNQALLDGTLDAEFAVGAFGTSGTDTITVTMSTDAAADSILDNDSTNDIDTAAHALAIISTIDDAIQDIATARATLGASQNRLTSTIANLGNMNQNLTAARSRIMDVDVASETSAMSRNQILVQAGASVLTQANTIPQVALSLLRGG